MEQELKAFDIKKSISESIQNSTQKPALIPFIVAGYPSFEATEKLLKMFEQKHAAAIEIGIPFSDPLADGPVIQLAAKEAIEKGASIKTIFEFLNKIEITTPFILFTYYNPVLHFGVDRFIEEARKCNISGFIIPDLPYEEAQDFNQKARSCGIDHIMLVAPTSNIERIKNIAKMSSGFIYLVSSTGVTGVRDSFSAVLSNVLDEIKSVSSVPVAVGFGISRQEHIKSLENLGVDGAIIGSAIIKKIHETKDNQEVMVKAVSEYIDELYS